MEIDVLRPQFMPAEMVAHWRALQAAGPGLDSPFLSPHWPRAVERAQDGADRGLRVAILHETGRPRGYIAVRAGGFAGMPPGAPLCDYQGLVSEPGAEVDARRLVQTLGVGRFDFNAMLADQAVFAPFERGRAEAHLVDLGEGGYAPYAAGRREAGVTLLDELDDSRAKVEREGGPIVFTPQSRAKGAFDQLFVWERERLSAAGRTDVFAVGWPLRLMKDLLASRDPDFGGALFTLHIGERLAAAHYALRGGGTLHGWVMAEDPAFERFSPGLLLIQEILRWMGGAACSRLDLGRSDEAWRSDLANSAVPVTHGYVGVPSPAAFVRGAQYRLRKAVESLPLGPVSRLPALAMHRRDLLRGLR